MTEEEIQQQTQEESTGFGRFEYPDGSLYEGNWAIQEGKRVREGYGVLTQPFREEYKGEWKHDLMDGFGDYSYTSGANYHGQWQQGKAHGKGIYEFQDGSIYDGEWSEHLMHGEGYYIDRNGNKWEGEFVNGVYQSKIQDQLKIEKIQRKKQQDIQEEAQPFFVKFTQKFSQSDKKTFKDHLSPFFTTADEIAPIFSGNTPKFEEKQPQQWNDLLTKFTEDNLTIRVLVNQSDSQIIDSEHILCNQLEGNGQIVEFIRPGDKKSIAVIGFVNARWVLLQVIDE